MSGECCAHARVSWRGDANRFWECDSGCGARFEPSDAHAETKKALEAAQSLATWSERERGLLNWHPHSAVGALRLIKANEALAAERARSERYREALAGVSKWCHSGHGDFPASGCGLCKPVFAALEEKP